MLVMSAAVLESPGGALVIREVTLEEPRDDEVLVRLMATGICHSDLHALEGAYGLPTPVILGHEGAGVVEQVGTSVRHIAPGDRVVLSFSSCGSCDQCRAGHPVYCRISRAMNMSGARADGSTPYRDKSGATIYGSFVGQSSFATHTLVHHTAVVAAPDHLPFEVLAPLGCGFQTGAGLVLNRLRPEEGDTLAVVGIGAVGMSAMLAALAAGCSKVVVVDTNPRRLEVAASLGAHVTLLADRNSNLTSQIKDVTGGFGVDFGVDTTAVPSVVNALFASLDVRGSLGLVGSFASGTQLVIDARLAMGGRRVEGSLEGDVTPQRFIPEMLRLHAEGKFPFDSLISVVGGLTDVNSAIEKMRRGEIIKPVLTLKGN